MFTSSVDSIVVELMMSLEAMECLSLDWPRQLPRQIRVLCRSLGSLAHWLTGSLCTVDFRYNILCTCVSRINNVLIDLNTKSMIYLLCVKRYTN